MDGLQFAEILQSENKTAGIPVILLADDLQEQKVKRYSNLGINKIFNNPMELSKFKIELEKI
jgi:CheY-like chemotaxis protein